MLLLNLNDFQEINTIYACVNIYEHSRVCIYQRKEMTDFVNLIPFLFFDYIY